MAADLFVYGSLMYDRVWSRVVRGQYLSEPAQLRGYRRHRVRGETYPGITRAGVGGLDAAGADDVVDGRLYRAVSDADLAALDRFEGPDYDRLAVAVACEGETVADAAPVAAQAYVYNAPHRLEPRLWDPADFERNLIDRFLATYPPTAGTGAVRSERR